MHWFKHMVHLKRDPEVADYLDRCGSNHLLGYGFFMTVVEVVSEAMEPKASRASASLPESSWRQFCNVPPRTFAKYSSLLTECGVIQMETMGNKCEIEIPKLLKWRDEYSRKVGRTPDSVRTMSHKRESEEADIDIETEKEEQPDPDIKRTEEIQDMLDRLDCDPLAVLAMIAVNDKEGLGEIEDIPIALRQKAASDLMPYIAPKLRALTVEAAGPRDDQRLTVILPPELVSKYEGVAMDIQKLPLS